jgi:hypothetical protein
MQGEPLDVQVLRIEGFGQRDRVGDLTGETRAVILHRFRVQRFRARVLAHELHCSRGGHRARVREASEDHGQAQVMVAVAMRNVDRGEPSLV